MKESSTSGAIFPTWAITRLWAMCAGLQLLPYPDSQYLFSDVRLYNWWAGNIIDGHFPINDPMWQYPPIAALLFTLGYLISPQTIGFVSLALTADAAIVAMLMRAGRRGAANVFTPAWLWVATPLVMGPIALGRFDVFPTACVIAALLATKPQSTGAGFAVGALLKVWPGLGLLAVKRSAFTKTFAAFIVTSVAITAALIVWWPGSFGFIIGQRSRGLQIESVGALPYMLWNVGSSHITSDLQFGSIEVIAQGTWLVGAFVTMVAIILFSVLIVWRLSGALDHAPNCDVMLVAVLTAMVTSRVLSPQYNLWALGLVAVCAFKPQPQFRLLATLLFVSAFAGQLLYPWLYVGFESGGLLATCVQVIRVATLFGATFLSWRNLYVRYPYRKIRSGLQQVS